MLSTCTRLGYEQNEMMRTIEAVIDEQGNVRLLESVHLPAARRALVTILEDEPAVCVDETALLSVRHFEGKKVVGAARAPKCIWRVTGPARTSVKY